MKKYLFLLIAICISQFLALNVSAYTNLIAYGNGTVTDRYGNVYATGYFDGPSVTFGTITLKNAGSVCYDMYIVKYDAGGNVLWAKSAGGSGNDWGNSIAADSSGNVYLLGGFASLSISFGGTTLTKSTNGHTDMFIVKYDPNGNVIWAKSAGAILTTSENLYDGGCRIVTDSNVNVYVTGYFDLPSITFGETTLTNAGTAGPDLFIVKFDVNGNVIWAESAGGSGSDYGKGIALDGSGNIYVTGQYNSPFITFGTTTLTNAGNYNLFTVKYDANGNPIWATGAGGNRIDYSRGIATDGSGNVYITGLFSSSSITFGTTTLINASSGYTDMFFVKYDSNGNVLWAERAGGTNGDAGNGITTDVSGNVFVAGSSGSSSITFGNITLNFPSAGLFIVKYNPSGKALWAKMAVGLGVGAQSVTVDRSGNAFMTGQFMSTSITFGTITLKNPHGGITNGYDMFIVKYDASGNVPWAKTATLIGGKPKSANAGINDPLTNEITVYPNPTSGKVILSTANSQSAINSIFVFNITGKEVFSRQSSVGSQQIELDLSVQPKGLYILLIRAGDNYYRRKIIVE